jgi:hypothetical protein
MTLFKQLDREEEEEGISSGKPPTDLSSNCSSCAESTCSSAKMSTNDVNSNNNVYDQIRENIMRNKRKNMQKRSETFDAGQLSLVDDLIQHKCTSESFDKASTRNDQLYNRKRLSFLNDHQQEMLAKQSHEPKLTKVLMVGLNLFLMLICLFYRFIDFVATKIK